jgi:hypothetical protein
MLCWFYSSTTKQPSRGQDLPLLIGLLAPAFSPSLADSLGADLPLGNAVKIASPEQPRFLAGGNSLSAPTREFSSNRLEEAKVFHPTQLGQTLGNPSTHIFPR